MPSTEAVRRGCLGMAVAALFLLTPLARSEKKFGPEYAGADTCQGCHEDIYDNFEQSPHKLLQDSARQGWKGYGCEACHGAGAKHMQSVSPADIRNPARLTAVQTDKICLSCHLNQPTHAGRIQSSHMKDSISCVTCHKIHANGPLGLVARTQEQVNQLCSGCHLNVMAQFQKPYRHKVPENAMTCVDCHNPHGSVRPVMSQTFAASEPSCFRCHGDKRGPFTFEHAPLRFEGCGACHEAHGSSNPRMLARHEVRLVCLECHANLPGLTSNASAGVVPPAFHDLRSPRFQNCTICHQKVHGSYVDRNLLR
ncbi:MAG TPA: DmsE family decaheme c-type cytochrome [Bryobacteraceae bacterium]|jgi:DmsE family decaheme c-type cytochrome|nr:DmsE family decaheme c-type cytochrome [Bryobacteraceae bacterium]